jgi:hypothetical protein
MWLVLQRILAGIGRAVRRLRGAPSARGRRGARAAADRAAPRTPHVRT